MKKLIVDNKFNNKNLHSFFANNFSGVPNSVFYKLLRKKDIRVNGVKVNQDVTLHLGDEVQVFLPDSAPSINVVFEDDNILVVNKPLGISVADDADSLANILKQQYKYIEPCHRLDRNTLGLVLFAKNKESLEVLLEAFKNHLIEKHYVCIVIGKMPKQEDTLNAFLFKDSKKSTVYVSDVSKKGYLSIITSYRVIKYSKANNLSMLDVHLQTGRTHQIRAHLAHIGHPILGDGKYGVNEINKRFKLKYQVLCAYSLKFNFDTPCILDNIKGKEIAISFPDIFQKLI
ncbi:MAG: RluA family pseudouridine synthase [Clostridia bacterium]|nr:RluA family pseudouridine synthase [Clostridia bacterium]